MLTAILAVILFVILILPHEFGHFVVAKSLGVQVNEFAFGMGPAIWKKQRGETTYSVRIFPIGGFCAMEGEDEESDNERAFNNKPAWVRILVLCAGSAMNVLIAVVIMSLLMGYYGAALTTVDQVTEGSPAEAAGLRTGDTILYVDDTEIAEWSDLSPTLADGTEKTVVVERNGEEVTLTMTPVESEGRYIIGVTPKVSHSPVLAVRNGCRASLAMLTTLFDALRQIFTGKASADDLSGPVGMISLVHESQSQGAYFFLYLVAFVSLNLALFNMLPFPALDGGRILFVFIRLITGKAVTDQMEGAVHAAGMILLLTLLVFVTHNDILRLFQ